MGPALLGLPGIDRMRAIATGEVAPSPIQRLTGLRLTQVSYGSCTVVLPASPWLQTQTGFFLSGVTALAADFALGGAIMSALPSGMVPVTSDLNFTHLLSAYNYTCRFAYDLICRSEAATSTN